MSLSDHTSPPSRIVFVADDLASATDCGVQMMTGGCRTVIPLRPDGPVPDNGARVKDLVLTGGTTAKMTVSELGADAIEFLQEIEPGIPLGHMSGGDGLLVVTKAGGFGGRGAILGSVERIAAHGQD